MKPEPHITQNPEPGIHLCKVQGDTLEITLKIDLPDAGTGRAWVRTNIGHASSTRQEIIKLVDNNTPLLGRDWFDLPMHPDANGNYLIILGLSEIGLFEAKCFFLPEHVSEPVWPSGSNLVISVEPAETCCGNTLYNAFVRQFGPNKHRQVSPDDLDQKTIETLDKAGYTIIPPSGTFRSLISDLDFIIGTLGCRIIQLLPIHPTPTTYARMGRFGSPYAALSFSAVDPALAEFDPKATPLEQFIELVDAIHYRNAKLFLDVAINHTGWAANLHATHPHWLVRNPDGKIEVPGAWGVTWADLARLDYTQKELWRYMADIFLTWCRRGVDGFRCDAGYMIPVAVWQYIIARVRSQFPGTIFLLEGLGGKVSVTRNLLSRANFNWAYSELFQNYDRGQVESYLKLAADISRNNGLTVHFAETHDNNRLALTSHTYARMRTSLCALLSFQGAFGFANGVEWFATEKINVHDAPSLNWGTPDNQVDHIGRLNRLLKRHPVFSHEGRLELLSVHDGNVLGLTRYHPGTGKKLLVLINMDDEHPALARWSGETLDLPYAVHDLLSGRKINLEQVATDRQLVLAPGESLCLTADREDLKLMIDGDTDHFQVPEQVLCQRLRNKVIEILKVYRGNADLHGIDLGSEVSRFEDDPLTYCRQMNRQSHASGVILWHWPRDLRREVMLPPGYFLMIQAAIPFHCLLTRQNDEVLSAEQSFRKSSDSFFALVLPVDTPGAHTRHRLRLTLFGPDGCEHAKASILCLSKPENARVQTLFRQKNGLENNRLMLGTNGLGSMMRSHVLWSRLESRYDGLLAANLNAHYPEDRRVMLTRCRGWTVFQGYSQEIGPQTLERFGFDYSSAGCWEHKIPTGHGEHVRLTLCLEMIAGKNMTRMTLLRHPAGNSYERLADDKPLTLILRPDIEYRNFHDTTKAFTGPETHWKKCVMPSKKGFVFDPNPVHPLQVSSLKGRFVPQAEWHYMVHRQRDEERGQDPDSDLFSPGFFTARLRGGESQVMTACVPDSKEKNDGTNPGALVDNGAGFFDNNRASRTIPQAMRLALDQYLVKRDDLLTVIAGYPWFLDWGRDTLIVARGLIAAGKTDEAISIVKQFARFEKDGTIPNMIHGSDTGNRDTSDAPLWLYTVCADLARTEKGEALFEIDCGGRSLRDVLISLARSLMAGTPNNIRMDPKTGLIFSPAHFTWMDTNQPAGTPRQGYPIEIQALWHAALELLSRIDNRGGSAAWRLQAERVGQAILKHFYLPDDDYLSDCLHASPGISAEQAIPDNALRPNQLLAITLNALPDRAIQKSILNACERLLVPGAIRSLDDQTVEPPLEIVHNGRRVNTPETPYWGRYAGNEDSSRKPAYHNGTAWTWLFPSYCEAWFRVYEQASRETALAWLGSSTHLINTGCVGHVPEILDGDAPHRQRGCDAQAWGVSELLRVWTLIDA